MIIVAMGNRPSAESALRAGISEVGVLSLWERQLVVHIVMCSTDLPCKVLNRRIQ